MNTLFPDNFILCQKPWKEAVLIPYTAQKCMEIAVFYTGLSIALILTGILFIRYWWLKRKTMLN